MRRAQWIVAAIVTLSMVGCRAPRDPDLDERIALHRAQPESASPAKPSPAKSSTAERRKRSPTDPPPRGEVEQRVYGEAELTKIMSGLPGEGDAVEATLETAEGTIRCQLLPELAPQTVGNFVALATGQRSWRDPDTGDVSKGRFYDGLTFHRTIANFIIQTGNPSATKAAGPGWTITRETGDAALFDQAGVLAMVDAGEDSHGSQFFVTVRASASLKPKYTAFGTCDNAALVKKIADADKHPSTAEGKSATKPVRPTRLTKVNLRRTPKTP